MIMFICVCELFDLRVLVRIKSIKHRIHSSNSNLIWRCRRRRRKWVFNSHSLRNNSASALWNGITSLYMDSLSRLQLAEWPIGNVFSSNDNNNLFLNLQFGVSLLGDKGKEKRAYPDVWSQTLKNQSPGNGFVGLGAMCWVLWYFWIVASRIWKGFVHWLYYVCFDSVLVCL